MWGVEGGEVLGVVRCWGGNIHWFSGGLSANECKYLNERDHKMLRKNKLVGYRVIFFSYMESGLGGIF